VLYSASDITVIVPYFNEQENIERTLEMLFSQSVRPHAIYLIDSCSTDKSSDIVESWVERNAAAALFSNLHLGTTTPGGSKQQGLRRVKTRLVAFMDCGLVFNSEWLKGQLNCLNESKAEFVSGVCLTSGLGIIDQSAIAHTYGAQRLRPVLPSSLIKTEVFLRVGEFLDLRASYDAYWVKRAKVLKVLRIINTNAKIQYDGVNFAPNLWRVFRKSITYAKPALQIPTLTPLVYIAVALTALLALSVKSILFVPLTFSYFVARTVLAIFKSRRGFLRFLRPDRLVVLVITGAVLDFGKLVGYTLGAYDRFLRRR
jgi:glycosyltransferase involved in cell wall biosynthesis